MRSERLFRLAALAAALASAAPASASPHSLELALCSGGTMQIPLDDRAPPEPTAAGACHALLPGGCRAKMRAA